ncbi:DUF6132 family protein [Yoonia sp.]|uniref:DUF6132 family protein n=1 Tax=Yoonia sp. TaxID=2212373 RepID=UPI003975A4ED
MDKAGIIRLIIAIIVGGGIGALMGYYGQCSSGTCPLTATPYRGAIYGAVLGLLFGLSLGADRRSDPSATESDDETRVLEEEEKGEK